MEIDLNVGLPNMGMQEVIINPAAAPDAMNEGFPELNDLMQGAGEEVIQVAQNFNLNDLPAEPIPVQQQVNNEDQIPHVNLPIDPVIDDSDDEIPLHMLLDGNGQNQWMRIMKNSKWKMQGITLCKLEQCY